MNKRNIYYLVFDIVIIVFSYIFALFLRFEGDIPSIQFYNIIKHLPILVIIKIGVYYFFKLYKFLWEYADHREFIHIIYASLTSNLLASVYLLIIKAGFPRSIFAIVIIIESIMLWFSRMGNNMKKSKKSKDKYRKRVMIIGAGEAGVLVLQELRNNKDVSARPVCFIDDDPEKINHYINGIPVIGGRETIIENVERYSIEEIIFAAPSMEETSKKEIIKIASRAKAKLKIVPGMYQFIEGEVHISDIREVNIEDLLGREAIEMDYELVENFISGKTVLITGAGGTIGTQLSEELASLNPKELILLDIYENGVYSLECELRRNYKDLDIKVVIDSIRSYERMEKVYKKHKPNIVFHAAAHKHVPLMEYNISSAIVNNVFGTYNIAKLADIYKVEKFVLISTDKAVNPTNVMGTTKRLCEMIISALDSASKTEYVAVRFGNVLGASGSVIPIFKKQIAEGGPITLTHKNIERFFMTIKEAAQLVLQASAIARGGEIFILDMGEQVKIYELAKSLINLSGKRLGIDIDIEITGLRPGEKMYEEILLDKDIAKATKYEKIFIDPKEYHDIEDIEDILSDLKEKIKTSDDNSLVELLKKYVESYTPNRENL